MLDSLKAMFFRQQVAAPAAAPGDPGHSIQLAACAMLLELAHADDAFTADERKHIETVMVRHFDLSQQEAKDLIALAEVERDASVDLFQFARLIDAHYDEGQKMVLAEVMWGLVHSDGELSAKEDQLMVKFSRLLDLRPGYLAEAKKRALGP